MKHLSQLAGIVLLLTSFVAVSNADTLFEPVNSNQSSAYQRDPSNLLQFAKAVKPTKHTEDAADETINLFDGSGTFVQLYTGYDYSIMGDISNGFNNLKPAFLNGSPSLSAAGGSFQNSGIRTGVLYGIHLDSSSSFALDISNVTTVPSSLTFSTGTTQVASFNLLPSLFSASIDYSLNLIQGPGSRTYVALGAGYYHGAVAYYGSGGGYGSGTFTGDNIGGTLGIGEEIALGSNFGFNFSLNGRYAYFSRASSSNAAGYAGGSGTISLALIQQGPTGRFLVPIANNLIDANPNIVSYAGMDFSGIDANAAVEYHFF